MSLITQKLFFAQSSSELDHRHCILLPDNLTRSPVSFAHDWINVTGEPVKIKTKAISDVSIGDISFLKFRDTITCHDAYRDDATLEAEEVAAFSHSARVSRITQHPWPVFASSVN